MTPSVEELIDSLRYRPVATTAAQMREAADALARQRAEIERLDLQVESLQNKWASRPIDHPNGEALGILNDNLSDENAALRAEVERLTPTDWCNKHVATAGCPGCIEEEYRRLRAALERIAKPYDCGCRPCHCLDSAETMRLDAQGLRDIAEQALAPPGDLK